MGTRERVAVKCNKSSRKLEVHPPSRPSSYSQGTGLSEHWSVICCRESPCVPSLPAITPSSIPVMAQGQGSASRGTPLIKPVLPQADAPQQPGSPSNIGQCGFSREELEQILQERNELKANVFLLKEELAYFQR